MPLHLPTRVRLAALALAIGIALAIPAAAHASTPGRPRDLRHQRHRHRQRQRPAAAGRADRRHARHAGRRECDRRPVRPLPHPQHPVGTLHRSRALPRIPSAGAGADAGGREGRAPDLPAHPGPVTPADGVGVPRDTDRDRHAQRHAGLSGGPVPRSAEQHDIADPPAGDHGRGARADGGGAHPRAARRVHVLPRRHPGLSRASPAA